MLKNDVVRRFLADFLCFVDFFFEVSYTKSIKPTVMKNFKRLFLLVTLIALVVQVVFN
jgi:hypothetical protein